MYIDEKQYINIYIDTTHKKKCLNHCIKKQQLNENYCQIWHCVLFIQNSFGKKYFYYYLKKVKFQNSV